MNKRPQFDVERQGFAHSSDVGCIDLVPLSEQSWLVEVPHPLRQQVLHLTHKQQ